MENLKRLFSLIPILHHNQGIHIEELWKKSKFSSLSELKNSLDQLMLFGALPFSPSDFISIYIDEEERIFLDFPLGLEKPLALSSREWFFLQKLVRKKLEFFDQKDVNTEALLSLLNQLSSVPIDFQLDEEYKVEKNLIQEAILDTFQIEFLYRTLNSKKSELRRIDPWFLFRIQERIYLIGYCHTRKAERCFLLERMCNLYVLNLKQEYTDENKDLRQKFLSGNSIFQKELNAFEIEFAFPKERINTIKRIFTFYKTESYEVQNYLKAKAKVQDQIWLRNTLRSLGKSIILLSPSWLQKSFLDDLKKVSIPSPFSS